MSSKKNTYIYNCLFNKFRIIGKVSQIDIVYHYFKGIVVFRLIPINFPNLLDPNLFNFIY